MDSKIIGMGRYCWYHIVQYETVTGMGAKTLKPLVLACNNCINLYWFIPIHIDDTM